jgi:hypothetical protein
MFTDTNFPSLREGLLLDTQAAVCTIEDPKELHKAFADIEKRYQQAKGAAEGKNILVGNLHCLVTEKQEFLYIKNGLKKFTAIVNILIPKNANIKKNTRISIMMFFPLNILSFGGSIIIGFKFV